MNARVLHVDMKGFITTPDYMSSLVERIAKCGYNYLLIEFEDKFPFEAYPDMVHKAAYSKAEFRTLRDVCRSCGVGIIPLLQSVGHLDYFLKHKAYRHLREGKSSYQWCLSEERTYHVWKTMVDEILEVFPDCDYFHIGADEVKLEGDCPRCKGQDRFALYVSRVERCVDYLRSRGKRVVMWDDMFRKHDLKQLKTLLEKVIPCVWFYRQVDETIIQKFAETGCEFWGASSLQSDFRYRGMTAQRPKQNNVDDWAAMNAKYHLAGHVGTIWGRIQCQSPLESTSLPQAMFMIAYLGESLMHGPIQDRRLFAQHFARNFFDLPEMDLVAVVENFSYEPELVKVELEKWLNQGAKNQDILKIWHAFNEIDVLFRYVDFCFCSDAALLPVYRAGMAPDEITNNWLDGVRIVRERTQKLEAFLDEALGDIYPHEMLREFKEQRFVAMLEQNDAWEKLIQEAKANKQL